MLNYPIGKQEFGVIRSQPFVYVDKTEWAYKFAVSSSQYFLSRPRRFGKSLLISTLKELFSGDRALFKGLWIEPHLGEIEKRPVIHIALNAMGYKTTRLEKALSMLLGDIAKKNNIELSKEGDYVVHFKELIKKMATEKPIALLIDEYDKPIVDHLDDLDQADANREILKSFYSVLKNSEDHIHLLFITGVSKFSKVSIFSDLNHLKDISLESNYATVVGFTPDEVSHYFGGRIKEIAAMHGLDEQAAWQEMRRFYNGYTWDGVNNVYNPFSLLSFLESGEFNNYWFETGTPTFLVEYLRKNFLPEKIEGKRVVKGTFNKFDLRRMDVYAVMFQTGYLTIQKMEGSGMTAWLTLGYPNEEVRFSFESNLLETYAGLPGAEVSDQLYDLRDSLLRLDAPSFVQRLKSFFASIPFDMEPPPAGKKLPQLWEGYFHALTFLLLKVMALDVRAEVASATGRTDAIVHVPAGVWVIEFKMGTAQSAMNQIIKQGYADPYLTSGKPVLLLGLGFDDALRNVKTFKWKRAA